MLNPCKEREPRVIDNALIQKCIDLQYPEGEVGRLLRLEGIPMEEVEQISFDYLYILKIDHLWVLKSLVKLSLNNNFIEKIENLETLVHLKELDLSFNKIKKIENLDNLIKLEKLSFYENLIETVENMDKQKNLTVFSIGKNRIYEKSNVNYFRRFPALTSLNMADNPCTEDEIFRLYVAAFLPNLFYYEYKMIKPEERERGTAIFEDSLKVLLRAEEEEKVKRDAIEKEISDAEMHSKMFVEHLNSGKLFEEMYRNDDEGKALLEIGEEVTELYEHYQEQFKEHCEQIFKVGEKHFAIRQTEIESFERSVERAKKENQEESIKHMEEFMSTKESIFQGVKECKLQLHHDAIAEDVFEVQIDEFRISFQESMHKTWKNLMRLEVTLFEQIEEVNQTYGQIMGEMINTFIEEVQGIFTNIRAIEVTFSENLSDAAVRYMTAININPDEELPESLEDILYDRDTLTNAMAATHDSHMQAIDGREDVLVHRARGWLDNMLTDMTKHEIKRNRYKILEINHFLDIQREEFEDLTTDSIDLPEDDYYGF
ncbi:dynein regulatory complex subunit 3-like [Anthonomus grandis grandis]|uniref:dynein regulatory complex subunit 3-like n=1 Tax=Anthonomus grandis grandis TaxID=2921223 RepID=UPI0021659475|nr:dynein regulatory complex subunit 3-like [Anthonomus grandis grandis]